MKSLASYVVFFSIMAFQTETSVAFRLSGLAGLTSQFLNGTHEFSELVPARMALLMNQSRSVLPLQSGIWKVVTEEHVRARLEPFHLNFNLPESVLFDRPERTNGKRPSQRSLAF